MNETLLVSPTVRLRACEPSDLMLMYSLENDASLWDAAISPQPISAKALRDFISLSKNDIYNDHQLRLTIDYLVSNKWKAVGFVDLIDFNPRNLRAEVGIGLLKTFRSKGIGTTALSLLERYANKALFIHQLYAYVSKSNCASLRLFQSCGFQLVGTLKDWSRTANSYADVCLFQKIL